MKTQPKPAQYETKNFFGTVVLKDWMTDLNDRAIKRVTGFCTLVQDVEIAGFKTRGTEANWAMRVTGVHEQWTILGCQIRAIVAHTADALTQASLDGSLILEQQQ